MGKPYIGQDSQLTVAKESEFKTRPETVDSQPSGLVFDEVDTTEEIEKGEIRAMGADRNYVFLLDSDENFGIEIPTAVQDVKMLEAVLGEVKENVDEDDEAPYTHEIVEATDLPTVTAEVTHYAQHEGSDDFVRTFKGSVAEDYSWESDEDNTTVEATTSLQSAAFDRNSHNPDSTTLLTKKPFQHQDLNEAEFNDKEMDMVSNISITVTNEIGESPDNGSLEKGQLTPLNRVYEIEVSHTPSDVEFHGYWRDGVEAPANFEWKRDVGDSIRWEFTDAQIEEPGYTAPLEEKMEAEMTIRARSLKVVVESDSEDYSLS